MRPNQLRISKNIILMNYLWLNQLNEKLISSIIYIEIIKNFIITLLDYYIMQTVAPSHG